MGGRRLYAVSSADIKHFADFEEIWIQTMHAEACETGSQYLQAPPSSYLGAHSSPTRGHPDTQEHTYHCEKVRLLTTKAALKSDDNDEKMQLLRKQASLENAYQMNVLHT